MTYVHYCPSRNRSRGNRHACWRGEVVAKGEIGVYHCWNRSVQRAFLCGQDPLTGEDYEYRGQWIQQTKQLLAPLFAIDVAFHAEMSNHWRTRPDVADSWSDQDVVRRWLSIAKLKRNGADSIAAPSQDEINRELRLTRLPSWSVGSIWI